LQNSLGIDVADARLAISVISFYSHLMTEKRARRLSTLFQREAEQGNRHLLSRSQQNIFLTLIGHL
jgi:hypothetical protein